MCKIDDLTKFTDFAGITSVCVDLTIRLVLMHRNDMYSHPHLPRDHSLHQPRLMLIEVPGVHHRKITRKITKLPVLNIRIYEQP